MALTDKEIINICRQELVRAQGYDSDELASNRKDALDYFYNRPRGDEQQGRSTIQSTDVSDMVEAVMANISPILSNETLISFEPAGQEDEQAAQMESDFTSYMVSGRNDGYVQILSAVKDALLLRNGFLKVFIEKSETDETETRTQLTEPDLQALVDSNTPDTTHFITQIRPNSDIVDTFDVTVRTQVKKIDLKIEAIAPENMLYSSEHDTPYLDDIRFIGERKLLTQTELLNMGYSKSQIMDLPTYDVDTKNDSYARRQTEQTSLDAVDPSQRIIETYDIHIKIDLKENGTATLQHIHLASHELLMNEPAPWIPYATGSPFLTPHHVTGQSLFDKLKQIQDSKTHFLRQWHDNARSVNNSRVVYNPLTTNEDDVLNTRAGGGIRSRDPASVVQLQTNDMGQSIVAALEYMDKQRSERGGASLDLAGAQMQLAGQVGDMGAERQISIKEQLAAAMTKTLANTLVRAAYLLTHKTLRAFLDRELTAKLNGKWAATTPSQWPERTNVNVMTGMSNSEKSQRLGMLNQVIQTQVSFMEQGQEGEITDKSKVYNALMDWSRAANLESPDQYWIDPSSEQAQQAGQQKQQQQAAAQKAQAEAMQQQAAQQQQLFQMQASLDKYKHDTELEFKYAKEQLDAALDEAKIIGAATLEIQQQLANLESQANQQGANSVQ